MKKTTVTTDGEVVLADEMLANEYPIFFKTPWNHDRDAESLATGLTCNDPTKAQQQFKEEADINNILRKFLNTGELNTIGEARYANIEELADLQDVIVTRAQVEEAWNALPAIARNALNDPETMVRYVEHCLQTGDLDPLRELGLANPKQDAPKPPEKAQEPPKPDQGVTPAPDPAKPPPAPAGGGK